MQKKQNTEDVRERLDAAFDGLYCFLSAYSPEFAPAELVISNVKNHIRQHEPVSPHASDEQLLVNAINYYSVDGPDGEVACEFFNVYVNNHELFLQNHDAHS